MDRENTTIWPSNMSSQPVVLHMNHPLHTSTIETMLPNEWSVQSLKRPGWWWLTSRLPLSSGEKQLIPHYISIKGHRMKAAKEMTTMAIKHSTKHHTRCCMDLENPRTMSTVTRYHIKVLSTTYTDSDFMPVDSSLNANSARDQNPAWW